MTRAGGSARPLVVALAVATVLAGCGGQQDGSPAARERGKPSSSSADGSGASATPTPSSPELPPASPWQPKGAEPSPEIKLAATRLVEALGTVASDGPADPGQRLAAAGLDPALARQAAAVLPPAGPAVTRVVYPQYGGLLQRAASVMVVADQYWVDGDRVRRRNVTVDVRVTRPSGGEWRATRVVPAPVVSVSADDPGLPPGVARLLADERVELPDAARADLATGKAQSIVVRLLSGIAPRHRLSVAVIAGGHPPQVYGTDRMSNHGRGRAVDVWAIDGVPVVEMAPDDPRIRSVLELARDLGADEIGAPFDVDGGGPVGFTNTLHRDHVHLGADLRRS